MSPGRARRPAGDPVELVLVRHAQTPSNVRHALDTLPPGPGLTELGHAQAEALADGFDGTEVGSVFTSQLTRTRLTAAPLLARRRLEPLVRDGLAEVRAGQYEMRTDRGAIEAYLSTIFRWSAGDLSAALPGGESGARVLERFDGVVEEAVGTGHPRVVLVSHGAAIRVWAAARVHNVTPEMARTTALRNACAIVVRGRPGQGWTMTRWDEEPPLVQVPDSAMELGR